MKGIINAHNNNQGHTQSPYSPDDSQCSESFKSTKYSQHVKYTGIEYTNVLDNKRDEKIHNTRQDYGKVCSED